MEKSIGNGHLELITPKFSPRERELEVIYQVFKKHNIATTNRPGGGHINVDLAAFEGRPRALARFLALFHEHQNILTLLLQHYHFADTGHQVEVSGELVRILKYFQGSEGELKQLLYNQRYFNTFKEFKTRYAPINLIDYFQDVIPAEFISQDFDAHNPFISWRQQFKVHPDSRRMELRFVEAPRTAFEAALHIRLVRAMLSAAFNENPPLDGIVQKIDAITYAYNPDQAHTDLKRLCMTLKLDCRDYYPMMIEALNDLKDYPYLLRPFGPQLKREEDWGNALQAERPRNQALFSHNRVWVEGRIYQKNSCQEIMHYLLMD